MSIHFPDSDEPISHVDDRPAWESMSDKMGWCSASLAGAIAIPTLVYKKKRVYTQLNPTIAGAEMLQAVQEIPEVPQCGPEAKGKIVELWTRIANGELSWGLKTLGDEIENRLQVHPLALLMNVPKEKIKEVFVDTSWMTASLRIPPILHGIQRGVEKAMSEDRPASWPEFTSLLPSFASHMNKEESQIMLLIQQDKWKELVHYLFDIFD